LPEEIMNFRRPQARPASLIGRPSANIAKRPNSTIAGGVGRASYGRMIVIDIFKENHRFSEQTSHPAPGSVDGAANLAASSGGEVEMPVGAVLVQTLYTDIPLNGADNSASVTLNFAPTFVVATSSIAIYQHQVNALGSYFLALQL
jgi:hypothetical protein